jgi:tetratricopeptide (TPR) repeat protein
MTAQARLQASHSRETMKDVLTDEIAMASIETLEETRSSSGLLTVAKRYAAFLTIIMAITVMGLSLLIYLNYPTAKRTILREINKGNLVKPEGQSAYDLYMASRANLNADDARELKEQAVPALENKGNEIIYRLKQDAAESEADWSEALRVYSWLNEIQPKAAYESRKYFSQARLEFLKKIYDKSIVSYRRSIDIDSSWAPPLNGLARAYINLKDKENAKQYYRRATEVEPNWIYPWLNLGALYIDTNDYKAAEQTLRKALSIDNRKATAHYLLGQTCEKLGRICEAINEYNLALANVSRSSSSAFNAETLRTKVSRLVATNRC